MVTPLADPERELALSYADRSVRDDLRTLWRLDERFGAIVAATTEPTIGEMRLLWWREALENLEDAVPSEPLLAETAGLLGRHDIDVHAIGEMTEGWHALLAEPIEQSDLLRFGQKRGGELFSLSASVLGDAGADVRTAGQIWALVDLGFRTSDPELSTNARAAVPEDSGLSSWPKTLRPLGALCTLALRDIRAGATHRRAGAPGRVARMAWHRLTGR